MRWVTYASDNGNRVGVLNGDYIHVLPPGVALIDLIANGREKLREIGEGALAEPNEIVALSTVKLRPPIPQPPSMRDCLCFLQHMRNCLKAGGGSGELEDVW